ncbi:hypothetical protein F5Y15DRAFT_403133 [Xylariaceae sp. FL0016]|nr:hypothetical protein F5Y15DRAFT_403133 [Xylariaceae sp. FL0016]
MAPRKRRPAPLQNPSRDHDTEDDPDAFVSKSATDIPDDSPSNVDSKRNSAVVWLPSDSFNALAPMWQDQYVWSPAAVDPTLPIEQTSFIKTDGDEDGEDDERDGERGMRFQDSPYDEDGERAHDAAGVTSAPIPVASPATAQPTAANTIPVPAVAVQDNVVIPPQPAPASVSFAHPTAMNPRAAHIAASDDAALDSASSLDTSNSSSSATSSQRRRRRQRPRRRYGGNTSADSALVPAVPTAGGLVPLVERPKEPDPDPPATTTSVEGKKKGLTLRLELNLDVEVALHAKLQGDISLELGT